MFRDSGQNVNAGLSANGMSAATNSTPDSIRVAIKARFRESLNSASQVQRGYENRICTSLPSSLRSAWKGVLKPRHFLGVRLVVMTMSWISSSDIWSMSI